jgi:glycosyltransferase involved in cell wall biosynthesis
MGRVSLVLTSYNQRGYLAEAIDSAMGQGEALLELIVVDDGSSDGSPELIRAWSAREPNCVRGLFHSGNRGIPEARNTGLRIARGDWVGILDGDDRLLPGHHEALLRAASASESGCAYSNLNLIDADGTRLHVRDEAPLPSGSLLPFIAAGSMGLLRSMLVRRELLAAVGYMDARFPKYDGYVLTLRLAERVRFAYVFEPLADYRIHAGGVSRNIDERTDARYLEELRDEVNAVLHRLKPAQAAAVSSIWAWRIAERRLSSDLRTGRSWRALARTLGLLARHPSRLRSAVGLWRLRSTGREDPDWPARFQQTCSAVQDL